MPRGFGGTSAGAASRDRAAGNARDRGSPFGGRERDDDDRSLLGSLRRRARMPTGDDPGVLRNLPAVGTGMMLSAGLERLLGPPTGDARETERRREQQAIRRSDVGDSVARPGLRSAAPSPARQPQPSPAQAAVEEQRRAAAPAVPDEPKLGSSGTNLTGPFGLSVLGSGIEIRRRRLRRVTG